MTYFKTPLEIVESQTAFHSFTFFFSSLQLIYHKMALKRSDKRGADKEDNVPLHDEEDEEEEEDDDEDTVIIEIRQWDL